MTTEEKHVDAPAPAEADVHPEHAATPAEPHPSTQRSTPHPATPVQADPAPEPPATKTVEEWAKELQVSRHWFAGARVLGNWAIGFETTRATFEKTIKAAQEVIIHGIGFDEGPNEDAKKLAEKRAKVRAAKLTAKPLSLSAKLRMKPRSIVEVIPSEVAK